MGLVGPVKGGAGTEEITCGLTGVTITTERLVGTVGTFAIVSRYFCTAAATTTLTVTTATGLLKITTTPERAPHCPTYYIQLPPQDRPFFILDPDSNRNSGFSIIYYLFYIIITQYYINLKYVHQFKVL